MNSRRTLKGSGNLPFPRHSDGASAKRSLPAPRRSVRFPDEDEDDDEEDDLHHRSREFNPLELIGDVVTAMLAAICIAGLSTIFVLLYVTVRPFSLPLYRRLAAQFGAASFVDALALLLPNTRIYLTGDSDVPSPVGMSLLVSNHLIDGDWWVILMLGRCVGLRGSVKGFLRNEYLQISIPETETATSSVVVRTNGTHANGHTSASIPSSFPASSGPSSATTAAGPGSMSSHTGSHHHHRPQDLSLLAKLLHLFLEFPLINGEDYMSNRDQLFQLLRSLSEYSDVAPVHLLFFPEGWSQHNGADRRSVLAKSNEFAKREGRPQLKHLLLPRTRGFNASLECLRESSPVVYDVTMACVGYDGSLPPSIKLNIFTLWNILRRRFPKEIHVQIKRYSMEEVFSDSSWLDKKWAEKDRLLSHFARHRTFPVDNRGFCRYRVFDTRTYSLESSIASLTKLLLFPCTVPLFMMLSIPLFWTLLWIWLAHRAFRLVFPDPDLRSSGGTDSRPGSVGGAGQTPGSNSAGTPYLPATPFASPSIQSWRDMFSRDDS